MFFVICYFLKKPKVFPKVNKSATWSHLLPGVLFSYLTRSSASSAMVLKRKNPLWPLRRITSGTNAVFRLLLQTSFCSPSQAESFGWLGSWAFKFPAVGGAQMFSSWWDHPLDPEDALPPSAQTQSPLKYAVVNSLSPSRVEGWWSPDGTGFI